MHIFYHNNINGIIIGLLIVKQDGKVNLKQQRKNVYIMLLRRCMEGYTCIRYDPTRVYMEASDCSQESVPLV